MCPVRSVTHVSGRAFKSINYRHKRFALHAFLTGSSFKSTSHVLFTINGLGTALSRVKSSGSTVQVGSYSTEGDIFVHLQPRVPCALCTRQEVSKNQEIRSIALARFRNSMCDDLSHLFRFVMINAHLVTDVVAVMRLLSSGRA
jgi:hypothetical protein